MKRVTQLDDWLLDMPAGHGIVMHSGAAHPTGLAHLLAQSAERLQDRRVYTLMPCGPLPYAEASPRRHLQLSTFLPGGGLRGAMDAGDVVTLRQALSIVPDSFARHEHKVGAVLLRVTPPDADGRVNLGVSVDYMLAAIEATRFVIAEIDPAMPRTKGASSLPADRIDAYIEAVNGPNTVTCSASDAAEDAIAHHIASLIDDGAVLQLGVGSLPERVLAKLGHLKHLGIHTGILGDGARTLIESGVIDNSTKGVKAGVSVATMALGSNGFYAFLHDNPAIELHPCTMTHSAAVLHSVGNLHAVNSALQIDLDGRVNAEWAGSRRVSLPGGLPDFARAAGIQSKGRSIIALRSVDRHGASSILSRLRTDVPCSLGPENVDFLVTEFGIASMRGHSPMQRRLALAAISHPNHRDTLISACRAL